MTESCKKLSLIIITNNDYNNATLGALKIITKSKKKV